MVGGSKYLLKSTTNFDLICGKKTTPEVGVDNHDVATIGLGGGGMEMRLAISVLKCSCMFRQLEHCCNNKSMFSDQYNVKCD